jgi:hypothetical protein
MTIRQALNITFSWLVSRNPRELAASEKVSEALSSDYSFSSEATVSDLPEETLEALLDSL